MQVGEYIFHAINDDLAWLASEICFGLMIVASWEYFAHSLVAVALVCIAFFYRDYGNWQSNWLSRLIDREIASIERRQRAERKGEVARAFAYLVSWRGFRDTIYRLTSGASKYVLRDFWLDLRTLYIPSTASVIAVILFIAVLLFLPHPPKISKSVLNPTEWWAFASADLGDGQGMSVVFQGLIPLIVALIVFVAESVRGSRSTDEKRVLLRTSNLWPLAVLIAISPLAFLYPPVTRITAFLSVFVTVILILAFARVLLSFLDVGASVRAQREFLKSRVRKTVLHSAKQRVGNKLLYDRLGEGKEILIGFYSSRAWLPDGERNYTLIDAPGRGILTDVNLAELKALAVRMENLERGKQSAPQATIDVHQTSGPLHRAEAAQFNRLHLIRRFQEAMPPNQEFSQNISVLAVPNALTSDKAVMDDVKASVVRIFKFVDTEPPSAAFRREMQSTKDQLIAAIRGRSLGSIGDLKQTYLTVAEEFLSTLVDLGGGYSSKQAREERSSILDSWGEIRSLTRDVRELLIAASETDSKEVIGEITFLPYAIAIRAIQAGDHLVFQEFLSLVPLIYSLASEKLDGPVRSFMIDRSFRYLQELAQYYIQPALNTGEDDGDE